MSSIDLIKSFHDGISNIAALSASLNDPTIVNVPYSLQRAYAHVLALGLEMPTYSWCGLDNIKQTISILNYKPLTAAQLFKTDSSSDDETSESEYSINMQVNTKYKSPFESFLYGLKKYYRIEVKLDDSSNWTIAKITNLNLNICYTRFISIKALFKDITIPIFILDDLKNKIAPVGTHINMTPIDFEAMLHSWQSWILNLKINDNIDVNTKQCGFRCYEWQLCCILSIQLNEYCSGYIEVEMKRGSSFTIYLNPNNNILKIKNKINPPYTYSILHYFSLNKYGPKCNDIYNIYNVSASFCVKCNKRICDLCNMKQYNGQNYCIECKRYIIRFDTMSNTLPNGFNEYIINIIYYYSLGITVNCCNINSCPNEIYFNDIYAFKSGNDINDNFIYKYLVNYPTNYYTQNVYKKTFRIFCSICTVNFNTISSCSRCGNRDVETICGNHKLCSSCNKPVGQGLVKAKCCGNNVGKMCCYCNEVCAKCSAMNEIKYMSKMIQNMHNIPNEIKQNIQIIEIISEYSVGYIVHCKCNKSSSVNLYSQFDLDSLYLINYNNMYNRSRPTQSNNCCSPLRYKINPVYIDESINREKYIKLGNNYYRKICQFDFDNPKRCRLCRNFDESETCLNHPACYKCNKRTNDRRMYSRDHFYYSVIEQCRKCNKYYCKNCGVYEKKCCQNCEIEKQYKKIKNCVYFAIGDKIGWNLVDIITCYSRGYLLICCNTKSFNCLNEITVDNITQLEHNIDSEGNEISQYSTHYDKQSDNRQDFIFLFGKYRRIFCSYCTKNNLRKCAFYYFCDNMELKNQFINKEKNIFYCKDHDPRACVGCSYAYHQLEDYLSLCCKICNKYICSYCAEGYHDQGVYRKCKDIEQEIQFKSSFTQNINLTELAINYTYSMDEYRRGYIFGNMRFKKRKYKNDNKTSRWKCNKIQKKKSYFKRKKQKSKKHEITQKFNNKYLMSLQY